MYEATRSRGFGAEVTRRILLGTYVLSAGYYDAYYRKAQQVRALIAQDFADVFASGVHLLFTPTTPTPAFPIGSKSDPYEMYLSDVFTCTANLAGVPAMSVPIGRVDGLPVGGQLIAPHFDERQMFVAAYALERALGRRGAPMTAAVAGEDRQIRDGRRARGARAAQDGDEDLLRLLDGLRRGRRTRTPVRCVSRCPARCPCSTSTRSSWRFAPRSRSGCEVHGDVDLRAEELLLSRPSQGIPDLAIRSAARDERPRRDRPRRRWLADRHRHHARAHGGGRRASRCTIAFPA